MLQGIPLINIVFELTVFTTSWLFYIATHKNKKTGWIMLAWLIIQGIVSYAGFYMDASGIPPHFFFAMFPALLTIALLLILPSGRAFLDGLDLKTLHWLHAIRVPVELVLFALFIEKYIPRLMTFEGRNLDILSGLSAPFIAYFGFRGNLPKKNLLLAWNFICLVLLLNIVANAALSAPFFFQQQAFDQPNIAILYFPYIWLPCFVVPVVFVSHIAAIRQLMKKPVDLN